MPRDRTIKPDPQALGLQALAWTLADDSRAQRFLALTGIDPADLRATADRPATLDAVIGFLEAHQPDLLACADALGIGPEQLITARQRIAG